MQTGTPISSLNPHTVPMELKRVDKLTWRQDAKNILVELRLLQDSITETYGYEGFSLIECTVNGLVEGKIVSIRYESAGEDTLCSLVEDDTVCDTVLVRIPD